MADVLIRTYESRDYDDVRVLFAEGVMDYLCRPSTFIYILRLPHTHITVLVLSITLHLVFRSYLASLLGVVSLLALVPLVILFIFRQIIDKAYKADLRNIEESYMLSPNSCFWVAESKGRVVGMVGVQAAQGSHHDIELRRLCVTKDHRHKGIARSLCRRVIDFAGERGYKQVNLNTTTLQQAAQKLYMNMGFRIIKSKLVSNPFGRQANVSVTYYTYDIKSEPPVSGKF
ncbi:probable N-acetyltransferase camello isoform X2 [Dendropsophus ebraccatus]